MNSATSSSVDSPAVDVAVKDTMVVTLQRLLPTETIAPAYHRRLIGAGISDANVQSAFLAMHALAIGVGALAAVWVVVDKNPSVTTWFPAAMLGGLAGWCGVG